MARMRRAALPLAFALAISASGCSLPIIGARDDEPVTRRSEPRSVAHAAERRRSWGRADNDPDACADLLTRQGVAFDRLQPDAAHGVRMPVRLRGALNGVEVTATTHDRRSTATILDCRLALALLSWAPTLRRAGITRIEHYSMYRPGARVAGSHRDSGHAHGLAIDAARFYLRNGTELDVLNDWEERDRGGAPCPKRLEEAWSSRLLRGVVCDAVDNKLFQIVITPHHDRAHGNHVHLERKPEVDWTYVR
jgi:hypothetical protein